MNHCVPEFEMEDDEPIPTASGFNRAHKQPLSPNDELVELLWRNGQVVMQPQTQKRKYQGNGDITIRNSSSQHQHQHQPSDAAATNNLFMHEDEMGSWLHYGLDDTSFERDFCSDLLYPSTSGSYPNTNTTTSSNRGRVEEKLPPIPLHPLQTVVAPPPPKPPIPPPKSKELESTTTKFHNFMHFSRPKSRLFESCQPSASDKIGDGSSETPKGVSNIGGPSVETDREDRNGEFTMNTSSGGSAASAEQSEKAPDNRKRKGREQVEDQEFQDEDAKVDGERKKPVHGSTSARRSRAAEVHNLSERRRRDRINEKMKALQELIPRCNKSDKASMLDEAIEYLKSLQTQVQVMSMGCMVPMVFPSVQQYMNPMGMGMGMGMGIDMGMNRPMMSFPPVMPEGPMPKQPSPAHFGPRLPSPAFHPPPSTLVESSTNQALNHQNVMQQIPNFTDPYQQYLGLHHMQQHLPPFPPQSQAVPHPNTNKGIDSLENRKTG